MENRIRILKNIEKLGDRYCSEYLNWDKNKLNSDWWYGLDFYFSHAFMRGRSDRLSNEYYAFTMKSLREYFSIIPEDPEGSYLQLIESCKYFDKDYILNFKKNKKIGKGNSIKHKDFSKEVIEKNPLVEHLITPEKIEIKWEDSARYKSIRLGNDNDVMMVLDALKFICFGKEKKNIYTYLRKKMIDFGVNAVYSELIELRGVSDKIATFIIRDIVLLNPEIQNLDYELAFPIDTWVRRISKKMGCESKNINQIKYYFINQCITEGINPLKFAAGLWILGTQALNILIDDCLDKIEL